MRNFEHQVLRKYDVVAISEAWKKEGYVVRLLDEKKDSKNPLLWENLHILADSGVYLKDAKTSQTLPGNISKDQKDNEEFVAGMKEGRYILDPSGPVSIAYKGNKIVGFVSTEAGGLPLLAMVDVKHRRKGLGAALYKAAGVTRPGYSSTPAARSLRKSLNI